jgi:hypothetical protein
MLRLGLILHLFIGSTIAGSAIVAVLVMRMDTLIPILIATAVGFIGSVPITYWVTKALYQAGSSQA